MTGYKMEWSLFWEVDATGNIECRNHNISAFLLKTSGDCGVCDKLTVLSMYRGGSSSTWQWVSDITSASVCRTQSATCMADLCQCQLTNDDDRLVSPPLHSGPRCPSWFGYGQCLCKRTVTLHWSTITDMAASSSGGGLSRLLAYTIWNSPPAQTSTLTPSLRHTK